MEAEKLKTGTTTVGIVTSQGIILAADRRATAGNLIVQKNVDKVVQISDYMAMTTAGSVSDIQLQIKLIRAELQVKKLKVGREPTVKEAANLLGGMLFRNIRSIGGVSHFLLGGCDSNGCSLYDLFPDGSVSEHKDFVCSGSGSVFAYGVLETLYTDKLTLEQGKDLAIKAVNAAIQRDNASGNGILLYTITADGVKEEVSKQVGVSLTQ